jgi:hypothetical protein
LSAQEQHLQHGIENKNDGVLEIIQGSHDLLDNAFLEDEVLIITESDIIEFNERQTMH